MRISLTALLIAAGLAACVTAPTVSPTEEQFPAKTVIAAFETPVMASEGDSADDPAIWIGQEGQGFIAGTDKQSGLYVYNLDGTERDYFPVGTVNNVDLRDGFSFQGRDHVLLTQSMAAVPVAVLGREVASLADQSDEITRALDMVFQGF